MVQTGNLTRTFNSPTSVTYAIPVVFKSSFAGVRVATLHVEDASGLFTLNAQQVSFTASMGSTVRPQVAVQPQDGSGTDQTFTVNFTGATAGSDLSKLYLIIATSVGAPQMCFVEFDRLANAVRVHTGAAWSPPITPGVTATAYGSQCAVNGSQAGGVPSGNTLSVRIPVVFASGFTGSKRIFAFAENIVGETTNWVAQGTWRIPVPGQAALPDVVSLTPSSGTGMTRTFTAVFSHGTAGSELYLGYILFLPVPNIVWYTAKGSCLIEYNRISHGIRLINDAGDNWLGPISGVPINAAAQPLSNSQCTVNVAGASASVGANDMTVNVPVTFKSAFSGILPTFLQTQDVHGKWTGMTQMGSWVATQSSVSKPGPFVSTVSSFGGSGNVGTVIARFGHTAGTPNIGLVHILLNSTIVGGSPCHFVYSPAANTLNLINDDGTAMVADSWLAPGSNGSLSNSRCSTQTALAFRRVISPTESQLQLIISFNTQAYAGSRNAYLNVFDAAGLLSHWTEIGTAVFQ